MTLQAVEDYAMLLVCLHQMEEVLVMVLTGMAVHACIIMYCDYAGEIVCCLVHSYLKDVLEHFQTKRHMQEPVSATTGIECVLI